MTISPRPISMPMPAASSEPRPSKTEGTSYPSSERCAISLPGANPSGTVSRMPEAPSAAMRSIVGLRAACNGVRPPSRGIGSSAIPSPRMMRYFMVYRILAMRMMSAKTPAAVTSAPAPYPLIWIGYLR